MALVKAGTQYDVVASKQWAEKVCQHLATKGFCVLDSGLDVDSLPKVHEDIKEMHRSSKFFTPAALITEGLFGLEGSSQIAELDPPGESSSDGDEIGKLDAMLTEKGEKLNDYVYEILDVDCRLRSHGLVHETSTGISEDDVPELSDREAAVWLANFVRRKVEIVVCLGPTKGTMELRPFDDEDAQAMEIETSPGMMIILRSDKIYHKHFAHGKVYLLTTYLMEGRHLDKRTAKAAVASMTPPAKALDSWCMNRLREIKCAQEFGEETSQYPTDFVRVMNQTCFKGQRAALRTLTGKAPTTYNMSAFFSGQMAGCDLVRPVSMTRWDHSPFFDADPESWRIGKTCCNHVTYVEGIDLFDNKLFGLSPAESSSMDPHQTSMMECGYEALHGGGYRKKTVMNSLGGVYMGTTTTEWGVTPKNINSAACATGGSASITANRFSFCLGMKGPSLAIDAEGASGLVALHMGVEGVLDKGRGVINAYSIIGSVTFNLYPIWWPQFQSAGLVPSDGRSKTFDESADGYGRGEGICMGLVKKLTDMVDGEPVFIEDEPLMAVIASSFMNNNGINSSLSAASATADQELICHALRNSSLTGLDVASVEVYGDGQYLNDAIEVGAAMRALRHNEGSDADPLLITAGKTQFAHASYAAGVQSLQRVVYSIKAGVISPQIHSYALNPHMEFNDISCLCNELLEPRQNSAYYGCTAKGFGGTNVHALMWGRAETRDAEERIFEREKIVYWPAGGGELDPDEQPRKKAGYFISGTWSRWKPEQMEVEGQNSFGYTVTLGENRWEKFQILLDGSEDRVLHPSESSARQGTLVLGPDKDVGGFSWAIDGRPWANQEDTRDGTQVDHVDSGKIGDRYRVRLRVAGKYRTVEWDKLENKEGAAPEKVPEGTYCILPSWSGGYPIEMFRDDAEVGVHYLEVTLPTARGAFQMMRNEDPDQILYPESYEADASSAVLGPDDLGGDLCWLLDGGQGDVFRIELHRTVENGLDKKKVSWTKVKK